MTAIATTADTDGINSDTNFNLPLLASRHMVVGEAPSVDDNISGTLWVHGHIVDE